MANEPNDGTRGSREVAAPTLFYNAAVIDHFMNPRNVGELAETDTSGFALVGDPSCGDQVKLWISVRAGRISRIAFKSFGCPGAIATSSMVTALAEGRTVEDARHITDDDVIRALGGIPETKMHCSLLGVRALRAAIEDWERRRPRGGMNTHLDCVPCFLRQSLEAARIFTSDARVHEQIVRDVLRLAAELDLDRPPPFVGQAIHRRLRELTGVRDPYGDAKSRFNRLALAALPELTAIVRQAPDPLTAAARCAVAANAIDMGGIAAVTDDDVRVALRGAPQELLHGDVEVFRKAAADATDILYLADNAGEIAVDRLLIEELGPGRVTVAVRGGPVLNDATLADASEVGMTDLVDVIDNGSDAPGTILADCSDSFRERFDGADLVIAKGQGNFETLSGLDRHIVFLFKVKCPVVSREVGRPVGTHALWQPDDRRSSRRDALPEDHP